MDRLGVLPRGMDGRRQVMRTPDEVAAMLRLHNLGWGTRRIAAEVGCNLETVQRYVTAGGWTPCRIPTRPGQLAGHTAWVADRLRRHRGNADVVRQELASELGVVGQPAHGGAGGVASAARACGGGAGHGAV